MRLSKAKISMNFTKLYSSEQKSVLSKLPQLPEAYYTSSKFIHKKYFFNYTHRHVQYKRPYCKEFVVTADSNSTKLSPNKRGVLINRGVGKNSEI